MSFERGPSDTLVREGGEGGGDSLRLVGVYSEVSQPQSAPSVPQPLTEPLN